MLFNEMEFETRKIAIEAALRLENTADAASLIAEAREIEAYLLGQIGKRES